MAQETASPRQRSNAYNIFILVLTVISLAIMVAMLLPINDATLTLLQFYDNLVCVIFLIDFFINLRAAPKKSEYFIKGRGWLDLIGSIPSLGLTFKYTGILRLARLSRFARISRLMRGSGKKEMVADVLKNRGQYTLFITILLAIIVLTFASALVLGFEAGAPDAKITTGQDALWYAIVTITTVGYGDYYPITPGGRLTAIFIMFAGVGIIGVLASLMSSPLIGAAPAPEEPPVPAPAAPAPTIEQELSAVKTELAALRQLVEKIAVQSEKK